MDADTATYTFTFDPNPCVLVDPVAPALTQSVCAGGMPSAPTLQLATTEGIEYSVVPGGPYVAGQQVTVTAQLDTGYGWDGDLPAGWVEVDGDTATYTFTFDPNPCQPAVPQAPAVTQSECVEGEPTVPTLTLAETAGIDYSVDAEAPYSPGQTVTVTAELQTGYEWGDMPTGWDEIDATTAEFQVVFDGNPCTPTSPVAPELVQSVCVAG
ncbi:hypothetical protein L600_000900001070, partial [Isoptericola variabilis J7]|uniref:InlB B-repeat-containing protein n=1 Tax=Isoptericola variabilis TaxID=139208 RepID=UPI0011ABB4DE